MNDSFTLRPSRSIKRRYRCSLAIPFVSHRRAAACVEMAVVLPIMLLITLGTLEICEGIFLLQKVEIAAHEGARAAIRKTGTEEDVESAVGIYLDARGIQYDDISNIVTSEPRPELANELEPIRVTVTLPTAGNFRMPTQIYQFWTGSTVTADVVMFKEFQPPPVVPN